MYKVKIINGEWRVVSAWDAKNEEVRPEIFHTEEAADSFAYRCNEWLARSAIIARPNTAWSATPLARLLAKIRAFVAARLKRGH